VPGGGATLIAVAVLLAAAGMWELAGSRGEEVGRALRSTAESLSGGRLRTLAEAALWLRIPERLERAGLAERVTIGAVLAGKLGGAALGAMLGLLAAPAAPGRLGIVVMVALPAAGFVAPEALLERAARRRVARLRAALPDALDLLAVAFHHILDPGTGRNAPITWRTVSVAASSCVDANAATTASIVRGPIAPAWLTGLGLPSRLVSADGDVLAIGGWPQEQGA
jgi:hypothetical protein